ncbi:MAG: hypothetical protein GXP49_05530 [Deltaproteobacteria bacterium]|nr:hypothetical protein [Deltaproteobacteria bacterium]
MNMNSRIVIILFFTLLTIIPRPVSAGEPDGAVCLKKGLKCLSDLNYRCAEKNLFEALRILKPSKDGHYRKHVIEIRLCLARMYVAMDELAKAEEQILDLLAFAPGYDIDRSVESPKVVYVFDRAMERFEKAGLNGEKQVKKRQGKKEKPESMNRKIKKIVSKGKKKGEKPTQGRNRSPGGPKGKRPAGRELQKSRNIETSIDTAVSYVQVFGKDANAVDPGFMVSIGASAKVWEGLKIGLVAYYERHGQQAVDSDMAFDVAGLLIVSSYIFEFGSIGISPVLGLGAQGMGLGKATKSYAFSGSLDLKLSYMPAKWFELFLCAGPRLVAASGSASMLLDIGLGSQFLF